MSEPPSDLPPATEWPDLSPEDEDWIAAGMDRLEERAGGKPNGHANGYLPEVRVGVDVHRVLEEALYNLAKDPLIFHRAHELVAVVGADESGRAPFGAPFSRGTPILRAHTSASLLPRYTRTVQFIRYAKPSRQRLQLAATGGPPAEAEAVPIQPPPNILSATLALGTFPTVREIVGITEAPVLRPDGSVHQDAGWDPATKYLFVPPYPYPHIDKDPSQAQAMAALEALREPFAQMPFTSPEAALVPVAAILTALARPAIQGAVPGFVFDASTRGSGKTLQADVVSLIVTGRPAARAHYPAEDEELHKTLASVALAGAPIFLLDNVTRQLGGGSLELVLTAREEVEFRILGRSEIRRLPWRTIIMASGNNITLTEDTLRRVLVSRLEPSEEHPEDREDFTHPDLPAWVLAERPRLVASALILLRAFFSHGFGLAAAPSAYNIPRLWGSFEAWSRLIPRAICFAGGPDVLAARPRGDAAASDELSDLSTLLESLPRVSPNPLSCREILDALYPAPRHDEEPDGFDDLRDALDGLTRSRQGMPPTAHALGHALRRYMGRPMRGRRLIRSIDGHGKLARWSVQTL